MGTMGNQTSRKTKIEIDRPGGGGYKEDECEKLKGKV
jgi:hypothetical protein